jgi:hypothetical protein
MFGFGKKKRVQEEQDAEAAVANTPEPAVDLAADSAVDSVVDPVGDSDVIQLWMQMSRVRPVSKLRRRAT